MTGKRRFGVVSLLGAPNVGKSTLVNALVGQKVAIVTQKAQTTRARLRGIAFRGDAQIVLVDTPGVFAPRRRLDRAMTRAAWRGSRDAEIRCMLVDAARGVDDGARLVLEGLRRAGTPAICVVNKIDLVRRDSLLGLVDSLRAEEILTDFFLVSALKGDGVDDLADALAERCPEGPWHYPEDQAADVPLRVMAAECVREQLYLQLHQEIPYDLTAATVSWKDLPDGTTRADVVVTVRRDSQKAIVLGAKGARIRSIGTAARAEIAKLVGHTVHLFLHVKVEPAWDEKREHYDAMGLEFGS